MTVAEQMLWYVSYDAISEKYKNLIVQVTILSGKHPFKIILA